jgi:hypothetical protein
MDRNLIGQLLLALCVVLVAVALLRMRHKSSRRSYKRSRQADETRWAAKARGRGELDPPPE